MAKKPTRTKAEKAQKGESAQAAPAKSAVKLPPGQQLISKFPVEGEDRPAPEALDIQRWRLSISGEVETPLLLTFDEFMDLPQTMVTHDIHCVTRWSRSSCAWKGVLFSDLAKRVNPRAAAKFVRFVAYSDRNHDTSLPLSVCLNEGVLFAHSLDGTYLTPEHGYPLRTVAPSRYFYKSLKWVREVVFQAEDTPGYWERSGYHNNADFTLEERYVTGNFSPSEAARLRAGGDFKRLGNRPLLSLDLQGGSFAGKDLSGLVIRNCNFSHADLRGANFQGANLTNCTFRETDLRSAIFNDADLSGVSFVGANLGGCVMRRSLLHATEFVRPGCPEAVVLDLDLSGTRIDDIAEEQIRFLKSAGVKIGL